MKDKEMKTWQRTQQSTKSQARHRCRLKTQGVQIKMKSATTRKALELGKHGHTTGSKAKRLLSFIHSTNDGNWRSNYTRLRRMQNKQGNIK